MSAEYRNERILIWGKTYPELSTKHVETVCTGGCLPDGRPIRIYPVDLRYLERYQQYRLYDWIEVPVARSTKDPRPESHKVRANALRVLERIPTGEDWSARRDIIMRDEGWRFDCLEALKRSQKLTRQSIGMVHVREVEWIKIAMKSEEERADHEEKARLIAATGDLFLTEHKDLGFLPWRIRMRWRCTGVSCPGHSATILDWGLNELGRREGEGAAKTRMEGLANLQAHDLWLFMGNLFTRQHVFCIIGLWYPKLRPQLALF